MHDEKMMQHNEKKFKKNPKKVVAPRGRHKERLQRHLA
jgi:hypothetical protein